MLINKIMNYEKPYIPYIPYNITKLLKMFKKEVIIFILIVLGLVVSGCRESEEKVTLPQKVNLSSDKSNYTLNEEVMLNMVISTFATELSIDQVELELFEGHSDDIIFYDISTRINLEDHFRIIEGDLGWSGIISSDNPKKLIYKLKALKEGKYSIGAIVGSSRIVEIGGEMKKIPYGGKREIIEICVVKDLSKLDEFCTKNAEEKGD